MKGNKSHNILSKVGRKNLALSMVALVLVSVMTVGVTYGWIENFTAIKITNIDQSTENSDDNTAILSIAKDINSVLTVGPCGYNANGSDSPTVKFNTVELGEYFREVGNIHMSACSGDGESFLFKSLENSGDAAAYRIGTEDDENVSYISATFKVDSPDGDTNFWFDSAPKVKIGGTETNVAYYSFAVDGKTTVYSKNGETYDHISTADGTSAPVEAEKSTKYVYGHTDNVDENGEKNGNTLFTVEESLKKEISVKIWLQDPEADIVDASKSVDIEMTLTTNWAHYRRIKVIDGTSNNYNEKWLMSESPSLHLALAENPLDNHWPLQQGRDENNEIYYYADIPASYYNKRVYVYRCDGSFNKGNIKAPNNSTGVNCWNYWYGTLPANFRDQTLAIIGNTPFDGSTRKQSDYGYVSWGELDKITVIDKTGQMNRSDSGGSVPYMIVHDQGSSGAPYDNYYAMTNNGDGTYSCYVPKTSEKISFWYKGSQFHNNIYNSDRKKTQSKCYANENPDHKYGFDYDENSEDEEPQRRPFGVDTYVITDINGQGEWGNIYPTDWSVKCSKDWNASMVMTKTSQTAKEVTADIQLDANKAYAFKLYNAADKKHYTINYGTSMNASHVITYSNKSSLDFSNTDSDMNNNTVLITLAAGNYRFRFNTGTKRLTIDYPDQGSEPYRVYMIDTNDYASGKDKYVHYWKNNDNNFTPYDEKCEGQIGTVNNNCYVYSFKSSYANRAKFFAKDGNNDGWWENVDHTISKEFPVFTYENKPIFPKQ